MEDYIKSDYLENKEQFQIKYILEHYLLYMQ